MSLKSMKKEELELLSNKDIAYMIMEESTKKLNTADLFKKIIKLLELPESTFEEKIADYYTALSTDKRFILLSNGTWDLRNRQKSDKVLKVLPDEEEDEEEEELEENQEDEDLDDETDSYDITDCPDFICLTNVFYATMISTNSSVQGLDELEHLNYYNLSTTYDTYKLESLVEDSTLFVRPVVNVYKESINE